MWFGKTYQAQLHPKGLPPFLFSLYTKVFMVHQWRPTFMRHIQSLKWFSKRCFLATAEWIKSLPNSLGALLHNNNQLHSDVPNNCLVWWKAKGRSVACLPTKTCWESWIIKSMQKGSSLTTSHSVWVIKYRKVPQSSATHKTLLPTASSSC